jgi:hypothetical protein
MKINGIHPKVKEAVGYDSDTPSQIILNEWNDAIKSVCKPCLELKYCFYGYLVEEFPLLPSIREVAVKHNEYLKTCIETGKLADGRELDAKRREWFEQQVKDFNSEDYPVSIPEPLIDASCKEWGHICPVYYAQSGATETEEARREGRNVPFKMRIRIARRDNYTCQKCAKHLRDEEMEFDHIIPVSRGGSTEEHNIRLTCFECNRSKSNKLEI